MGVYFIHAEVLERGALVAKICAISTCSNAEEAFDWFMDSKKIADCKNQGRYVIIDKLEKVE